MDSRAAQPGTRVVVSEPPRRGMSTTAPGCSVVLVGAFFGVSPALAQDAAQERSQSFRAVQGAAKESVPGGPLLVAAYGAIWLAVFFYVIRLVRQQQRAQADLLRLERVLTRDAGPR
jgi:CcmD family protein